MAAKDYKLCVTGITNTVMISKPSKSNPHVMTTDRVAIDKSEFIGIVLEWTLGELDSNDTKVNEDGMRVLSLTSGGRVIAEIHVNEENINWIKKTK